jgi:hypothetical protein
MSKRVNLTEDYLDEDPDIPGQKYALLSFLSPENVLARKDEFFFEKFVKAYEIDWKVKNLEKFLADTVARINNSLTDHANTLEKAGQQEGADLCRKCYVRVDDIMGEYQGFIRKHQREINSTRIAEDYKDFLFREQQKLEDEFHAANDFRTTVRGIKVRGVVRDEREAQQRVKRLQASDKIHNIFMAEVGKWTPWDPAPSQIQDQEYAQEELNALMKKYRENEQNREIFFEEQKKAGRLPGQAPSRAGQFGSNSGSIEVVTDTVSEPSHNSVDGGQFTDIFRGPADLALQRKMDEKNV